MRKSIIPKYRGTYHFYGWKSEISILNHNLDFQWCYDHITNIPGRRKKYVGLLFIQPTKKNKSVSILRPMIKKIAENV